MNVSKPNEIRNIAFVSHSGAGKTTLAEALLCAAGATPRRGRVEDGTSHFDFEPEEIAHQMSLSAATYPLEFGGVKINLVDTPGDQSFTAEALNAMRACDAVIVLVSGPDGVQVGTTALFDDVRALGLPVAFVVTKLEREHADFEAVVRDIGQRLDVRTSILTFPVGVEAGFTRVVDVLRENHYTVNGERERGPLPEVPTDVKARVAELHRELLENVAEHDDSLIEKYLAGQELTIQEVSRALAIGIRHQTIFPVFAACSMRGLGLSSLLQFFRDVFPSPSERGDWKARVGEEIVSRAPLAEAPLSAFVFKTTVDPFAGKLSLIRIVSGTLEGSGTLYNATRGVEERYTALFVVKGKDHVQVPRAHAGDIVAVAKLKETATGDSIASSQEPVTYDVIKFPEPVVSYDLVAQSRGDEDKIALALHRLREEDPTLHIGHDEVTKEILVSGVGQRHIEITLERLARKARLKVEMKDPRIPYRETVRGHAKGQGRYKRQTGGRGQFGDCWLEIEPLPRGRGYEFVDKIVGGAIPRGFIPAVDKGVHEALAHGVLAGFPTVDVRITCYDGSYHDVDSSEMAFKIAGSLAFKKVAEEATPILLEPLMRLHIEIPEDCVGEVVGDLNHRRGRVLGIEVRGRTQIVEAQAPMAEVLHYAADLNRLTSGRGHFSTKPAGYEEVPPAIAEKVIEQARAEHGQRAG